MANFPSTKFFSKLLMVGLLFMGANEAKSGTKTEMVQENGVAKVGKALPTFGGWSTTGDRVALRGLLKKTKESDAHLVISVFSSTCRPCRKGLPLLQKFSDSPKGKKNEFVLIAYGETNADVGKMLKELKVNLLVVEDKYMKISENIGVNGVLPRTYVVDKEGIVKAIITAEGDDFVELLTKLTKGT